MVTPLRDILKAAVRSWGLEPAARLAHARKAWHEIAGPALADVSAPLAVRGRRLRVAVTNPAAAQEIRFRSTALAQALNKALGEEAVAEVVAVPRRSLRGAGGTPRKRGR